MDIKRKISVKSDLDVVTTRMQAREIAKEMGFQTADQARISLATSELARMLSWNTDVPGEILISETNDNGHRGFQVLCRVEAEFLAVSENAQESTLASMPQQSLTGARRLVDESVVEPQGEKYILVKLVKWLK